MMTPSDIKEFVEYNNKFSKFDKVFKERYGISLDDLSYDRGTRLFNFFNGLKSNPIDINTVYYLDSLMGYGDKKDTDIAVEIFLEYSGIIAPYYKYDENKGRLLIGGSHGFTNPYYYITQNQFKIFEKMLERLPFIRDFEKLQHVHKEFNYRIKIFSENYRDIIADINNMKDLYDYMKKEPDNLSGSDSFVLQKIIDTWKRSNDK